MKPSTILLLILLIHTSIGYGGLVTFKYYCNEGSFAEANNIDLSGEQSVEQQLSVALGEVPLGINHLHMRVEDSSGIPSHPQSLVFYKSINAEPIPIVAAEYFWDSDPGWGQGAQVPLDQGVTIDDFAYLDLSALEKGIHHLGFRVKNQRGKWSMPQWLIFLKTDEAQMSPVVAAEYFWDADPGWGFGNPIAVTPGITIHQLTELAMQSLSPGSHYLGIRVKNELGIWSLPLWHQAYRIPFSQPDEITALGWYFTGNALPIDEEHELLPNGSGLLVQDSLAIPLTSLEEGQNYLLHVYALNSSGIRSHEVLVQLSPDWTPRHPVLNYVNGTIYLTWDPVSGAESYKIMASALPEGPFSFLAEANEPYYQDTPVAKRFYQVKAINSGY